MRDGVSQSELRNRLTVSLSSALHQELDNASPVSALRKAAWRREPQRASLCTSTRLPTRHRAVAAGVLCREKQRARRVKVMQGTHTAVPVVGFTTAATHNKARINSSAQYGAEEHLENNREAAEAHLQAYPPLCMDWTHSVSMLQCPCHTLEEPQVTCATQTDQQRCKD